MSNTDNMSLEDMKANLKAMHMLRSALQANKVSNARGGKKTVVLDAIVNLFQVAEDTGMLAEAHKGLADAVDDKTKEMVREASKP